MRALAICFLIICIFLCGFECVALGRLQTQDRLTPIQREIEKQRQRLSSAEPEDRRDALMQLANLHRADASRAAAEGLNDAVPSVRVAAAHAVTSLPHDEAAGLLLPLLQDKSEFVRRETAYALGKTRSRTAVTALQSLVETDKQASVRAAGAVALGAIGDEAAVPTLSGLLSGASNGKKKSQKKSEPFLMRTAARSLGQIRSAAAVNVLVSTLSDEGMNADVRREAASALGMIGDPAAVPALRTAVASNDPYVSESARAALRKMHVPLKN